MLRLGLADHFGWAVAVTASPDHAVVDRRRMELVDPELSAAPIHYEGARLGAAATADLVAQVRASVASSTAAAFDELEQALTEPVTSISLRALPDDFPDDIETQLQSPWEARADAVMYRRVLVEQARDRGWDVSFYLAKDVVGQAVGRLGDRAEEVLQGPRATLGPPWTKDHRVALAATVVASPT